MALNDISTQHVVGLYWVPGHPGVWGNEIADKLARCGSLDLSQPWESLDKIYKKVLVIGWLTSIGQDGEALAKPEDRLEN
jgi:hypothetical protein